MTHLATQRAPRLVRDGVYERLRDAILSCALRPGAEIHEQTLASRYKVSKSPIRDALLRLQEQRLVEVLPRKGYRVRPISVSDAAELYEMRELLERACVVRVIEDATDEAIRALDAFRTVPRGIALADWIAYNRRFHIAIAARCGNGRLARAATEVIEQFDRLTYVGVDSSGRSGGLQKFVDEHCAIIDAIKRRDRRQAQALVSEHVASSRKRTLAAIANPVIVP
jgi:GntR family transcriptional regulator, rspAB operon transcriptional repressor